MAMSHRGRVRGMYYMCGLILLSWGMRGTEGFAIGGGLGVGAGGGRGGRLAVAALAAGETGPVPIGLRSMGTAGVMRVGSAWMDGGARLGGAWGLARSGGGQHPGRRLGGEGSCRRRGFKGALGSMMVAGLAAETLQAVSSWMPNPVVRDVVCAGGGALGAVGWLKIWTSLSQAGLMDSKVSRKVVHCGSGPLFLLTWPLFSQTALSRAVASLVPIINGLRLFRAGTNTGGEEGKSALVSAISRSGRPEEVLQGPFLYTMVLLASCAVGWTSVPAIAAICQMAAGDGMADLVGRRWGTVKWPWSQSKSIVGSLAFFAAAFAVTLGEIAWFHAFGLVPVSPADAAARVAIISAACTMVELIPFYKVFGLAGDDNLSVPITAAALAVILF